MIFLKQGLAVLIVTITLFTTACTQKEEECTPPAIEQNIIGTWTFPGSATIEFQVNGTLIDLSPALVMDIINTDTLSITTYSISNDTLYTNAASPTTTTTTTRSYPIIKNDCNEITLNKGGSHQVLTRV